MNHPNPSEAADPSPPVTADSEGPSETPKETPVSVEPPSEVELAQHRARDAEGRLRVVSKAYTDLEADMDAFRRRMTANADQRVERKSAETIEAFFEPVMNLRRSMQGADTDPAATLVGLRMTLQQFQDVLTRLGLEEIQGVGSTFDPIVHEALATMPVTDAAQDGKVLHLHATGYRIGSKILQPAQVVIGKHAEN